MPQGTINLVLGSFMDFFSKTLAKIKFLQQRKIHKPLEKDNLIVRAKFDYFVEPVNCDQRKI